MTAEAEDLLTSLVEIPSVNPRGRAPDRAAGEGEAEVAAFVRDWLAARGIASTLSEVLPGRPNVVAVLPGRDPGAILLESHLDTVETADAQPPGIRDGRLYGRGACDAKGPLAAFMLALAALAAGERQRTVILAAVSDEEHAYRGVTHLLDELPMSIHGAIVGEPTGLLPVIAHKGVVRYTVRALGKAAHSSRPADGVNAISRLIPVLERLSQPLETRTHPLLGPATRCATRLRGGTGPNTIPDRAEVDVDRRTLPGEDPWEVWHAERAELAKPGEIEVDEPFTADYALDTPAGAGVVAALCRALAQRHLPATPTGLPFGTDASKLARAGIPSVVFGPGAVADAHSATESVAIADVVAAAEITAEAVCG